MNKVELLAPAGNLEKAKIALIYGADAVYIGGKKFSLRARASNFELDDIKEICRFAHERNKKVYVTTNIIPHDEDMDNLDAYLFALNEMKVDAIITSSLTIIERAKSLVPNIERHVSTQMSITNSKAISFYEHIGCQRVVLAREVTLKEIEMIKKASHLELEIFIHGGMCSSYSGRCVLSNHLTNRDANRGGCAHSCRWNYILYKGNKKLPPKNQYFNMGSKDLMALKQIPKLIDEYISTRSFDNKQLEYYIKEINKAENRLTSVGFLEGMVKPMEQLYDTREEHPTKEYIGYILDYDLEHQMALVEQRNYFAKGDVVELFGPTLNNTVLKIEKMIDYETKEEIDVARHPLQKLLIYMPVRVKKHDMMRKVK